jgi:pantoate--beta-alanine ligase
MSSRNAYLSAEERQQARALPEAMNAAAAALQAGGRVEDVEGAAISSLASAGFGPVDYVQVHDGATMARLGPGPATPGARVFVAAWLGKTRLIDNRAV